MNKDESIADTFLRKHYIDVIHEPDGNIPPDFSVNNTVGVEVRRLNQQYRDAGTTMGLEKGRFSLLKAIEKEISQFPRDTNGKNYWLRLRYARDIGKLKEIKKNIKLAISEFQLQNENTPFEFNLSKNVTLGFDRRNENLSRKYKVAIESDLNRGGWVIGMYVQETMHCINDKKEKIKSYQSKYKTWWLLLVDHIDFMGADAKQEIVKKLTKPSCFERVIVIKSDGAIQFEI